MSNWGQTVKNLECQAEDSDCVLGRAGFSERDLAVVCYDHSSAMGRLGRSD